MAVLQGFDSILPMDVVSFNTNMAAESEVINQPMWFFAGVYQDDPLDIWHFGDLNHDGFSQSVPAQRELDALMMQDYFDDFYHRIHITPSAVALGNVVSTQSTPVLVWNAHLDPKTLSAIEGLAEGITVSGQPSPPLLFNALQERVYQLSITPDGQPVLDTIVEWVFTHGETPGVRVTANRIIAFTFLPDWGDSCIERLAFLTDVLTSESWMQQRRSLRTSPRREVAAPVLLEDRERQLFDMTMFGWGSRIFALPFWPDIQRLKTAVPTNSLRINCETADIDFHVDGLAILLGETAFQFEVVEIEAVDASGLDLKRATQQYWPANTRLYPSRTARLTQQPEITRLTDSADKADVEFMLMETSDWPSLSALPMHRGWPVLDARPNETEDLTRQFQQMLQTLDSEMALPLSIDVSGQTMPLTGWHWLGEGRSERTWLRSLIYTLNGKQAAIWVPTYANDLTLMDLVSDMSLGLVVANIGYTRFAQQRPGRRDVRIELRNGQVFYRHITGSIELDSETEQLSIDTSLGVIVSPDDVSLISWMVLSISASDVFEIEHVTDAVGVAKASLMFSGVRDDDV